jgi:hypothetical protein
VRTIHKGSLAGLAAVAGSTVAILSTASPASAATAFTNPTQNPFTVPVIQSGTGAGKPLPFAVAGSGYLAGQQVLIEICDGLQSSNPNWDPTIDCDPVTSPGNANNGAGADANGNVAWAATNQNNSIGVFRGQSPQQQFNCVAQEDVPNGTPPNSDGSFTLTAATTANGEPLAAGVESWTN